MATSMPCMSHVTKRGNKMPTSCRKSKVRKPGRGGAVQMPWRVGARGPVTAFAGSKQVSPLLLRRSQIRFKWHLAEERRSARVSPESALHLGYWSCSPWSAERDNAALVLQAHWRMCLARQQYRSVQHAALTIQRQWREFRRLSSHPNSTVDLAIFVQSNICSETNGSDDLGCADSESLWEELAGTYGHRSLNMSELSVGRLSDANISATQEEEIVEEFLSLLPCLELDFSDNDIYDSSRGTGCESGESSDSPSLPESAVAEDDGHNLQAPLPMKTWNYGVRSLDSPACSPAKELTFARISIDGSLPPTPIKEWRSRKREPVRSSPAVVLSASDVDMVEVHHSPIKDWASPLTKGRKSAVFLVGSPTCKTSGELFQLPTEWFTDLDELETLESCWDTSEVTSISFSPPSDPTLKPLHGFAEVSSPDLEIMVSGSGALICIPEESVHDVSPSHQGKECANFDLVVKSPISVKPLDCSFDALSSVERSSASSVYKKYFLQSPSSRMGSEKCDSDTESVASPKCLKPANLEYLFEEAEKKASAMPDRAQFSCEEPSVPKTSEDGTLKSASDAEWNDVSQYSCFEDNYETMLKQRDHHRLWFPENLSGPLLLTNEAENTDCSFRKSTSSAWDCGLMTLMTDGGLMNVKNSSPSLHDLCKVWDDEGIDLVTRSLKYKSLMTDPDLLRHELKMAFEKPEPTSPQSVAWEIQNIERLKEKLQNRETLKELIQQQRDTIYINIATNASMRERYRLYSKWGIRRMSRGRLRKVIYELLWKDPKSAITALDNEASTGTNPQQDESVQEMTS